MRLGWVLVLACACGSGRPTIALTAAQPPPAAEPPPPKLAQTMIPSSAAPADLHIAPPTGSIHTLAITPDGSAALTGDEAGGTRLWPTLDGTQEPRIVAIDRAIALAITRRGDGYLAAVVDDNHGLTLVELDGEGRTRAHRSIGGDPSVVEVHATGAGILVWTSDEKLTLYDLDGNVHAALATRAGERITTLATNGNHAIVELEISGSTPAHRVRTVAIEPAFAWGGFVDASIEPTGAIAVSPSGERIAMIAKDSVVFVDAVHDTKLSSLPSTARSLAFADDGHVAGSTGALEWYEQGGLVPTFFPASSATMGPVDVVMPAAGKIATIFSGGIAIASPKQVGYLGFAIIAPTVAVAAGSGALMVAQDNASALVDAQLQTHGATELGSPTALAWLGGDDWLANGSDLRVVSTRGGNAVVVATNPGLAPMLRYEPSTQVATASFSSSATAYHWDAAHRTMTSLAADRSHTAFRQIELQPTDDASHRTQMVRVTIRDRAVVEWFADAKLTSRTATYDCDAVLAIDRAGRIYTQVRGAKPYIAIVANGAEVGQLPASGPAWLFPDPANSDRIVVLGQTKLELYTKGVLVWSRASHGARSAVWLSDGKLAVVTSSSIARLDPATGDTVLERCGFAFGLSTTPLTPPPAIPCGDGLH